VLARKISNHQQPHHQHSALISWALGGSVDVKHTERPEWLTAAARPAHHTRLLTRSEARPRPVPLALGRY
jgi:hypothetical protein